MADTDHDFANLYGEIERYYTTKVQRHGACALGVDWPCEPSQELRFVQLLKLCAPEQPFSLNDFGCGYGALCGLLDRRFGDVEIDYLGIDLSPEMIRRARQLWGHGNRTRFAVGASLPRVADYSVASGVFNVKLKQPHSRWVRFVKQTLAMLNASSRKGFAVNFLAKPVGEQGQIEELYRTTAEFWRAHCERNLNSRTQVLSDYGMCEFTLIVRS